MGADIYFENGEYFRDSYNDSNLAWVVGLSYWSLTDATKEEKEEFMATLANITDEDIDKHVEKKMKDVVDNSSGEEWKKMFREKRDFLKALADKDELKIDEDGWSV